MYKPSISIIALSLVFAALAAASLTGGDLSEGKALLEAGKLEEAKALLLTLSMESPDDDSVHYFLGRALFRQKEYDKAVDSFEKAVKLNQGSSLYYNWLGNASIQRTMEVSILKKPGYAKKARKAWEKAVELDPDNLEARMSLIQFYSGAPGIMGGGDDKALQQAEEIIKRDSAAGHVAYGNIYASKEEYARAVEEFQSYLKIVPEDSVVRFSIGIMYHELKEWDQAFDHFEAMVEEYPDWMSTWYQLGRTGALSGQRLERAEEAFKYYLTKEPGPGEPSHASAHFRLGNVYEHAERLDEARKEYEAALAIDPKYKEAKEGLKRCEGE